MGAHDVINVKLPPFNAYGDGIHDDAPAIQAALDAAGATPGLGLGYAHPNVYLPAGLYLLSHPLFITDNLTVYGDSANNTYIYKIGAWSGSTFVLFNGAQTYPARPLPKVPALLTGPGQAWKAGPPDIDPQYYPAGEYAIFLEGSPYGATNINGLTAITIECTYKSQGPAGTWSNIFVSGSSPDGLPIPGGQFFKVWTEPGREGQIFAALKTTGGTALVGSTTVLPSGTQAHLAITYDGAFLRAWVNGVKEGEVPLTGTIIQSQVEDVTLMSPDFTNFPHGGLLFASKGICDSFRISTVARYSSTFTPPTAKFTYDAQTKYLTNFEFAGWSSRFTETPFLIGYTNDIGGGPIYTNCRRITQSIGCASVEIHDLALQGDTCIEAICANDQKLWNLYLTSSAIGLWEENNNFGSHFDNILLLTYKNGIINTGSSGVNTYTRVQVTGGMLVAGAGMKLENCYLQLAGFGCIIGADGSGDGIDTVWDTVVVADEGNNAALQCMLIRNAKGVFRNCAFESLFGSAQAPAITVAGQCDLEFQNCTFNSPKAAGSVFKIQQPQNKPLIIAHPVRWIYNGADPTLPFVLTPNLAQVVDPVQHAVDVKLAGF